MQALGLINTAWAALGAARTVPWTLLTLVEIALLLACFRAWQLWHRTSDWPDRFPATVMRTYPTVAGFATVAFTLLLVLAALPESAIVARAAAASTMVAAALLGSFLERSIRRRGRPVRLVPPHLGKTLRPRDEGRHGNRNSLDG